MNIKKLRELKKNKKGFTLIEIIVVIVILAVLMAVAVPSVLNYLNEADNAKYISQARAIMQSSQTELVNAYAPDATIDATEAGNIVANVSAGLAGDDITVSDIKYYSDNKATSEIKSIAAHVPTDVKAYKVIFAYGGKTVNATIIPNGSITIDSVVTTPAAS